MVLLCFSTCKRLRFTPSSWSLHLSFGCVAQPTAYAAAVVSRVLSYQLTYFLCSQPHGPVYKPLPAEDVEYSAWKIHGHSSQLAKDHEKEM